MITIQDATGKITESWDDTKRTHTNHVTGETRPYTPEENTTADAVLAADVKDKAAKQIDKDLDAAIAALQVIIDDTKSLDPTKTGKDLAKVLQSLIKAQLKKY